MPNTETTAAPRNTEEQLVGRFVHMPISSNQLVFICDDCGYSARDRTFYHDRHRDLYVCETCMRAANNKLRDAAQ